jgi:hypothetical protein
MNNAGCKSESEAAGKIVPLASDLPVFKAACIGRDISAFGGSTYDKLQYAETWNVILLYMAVLLISSITIFDGLYPPILLYF